MLPFIRWSGLFVLGVALVLPALGADTKSTKKTTDDTPEKKSEKKEKAEEYVVVGNYEGQIKEVGAHSVTLEVTQYVPDPTAQQKLQQLQVQLAQQRNPQGIANIVNQLQQAKIAATKGVAKKVPRQFEAAEDCKVRVAELPVEYDDKGKPKKYTKSELATKKGGASLWGYPAEFEQVAAGQYVKIYLGVKKSALKKKAPPPKKGKGAVDDDADMDGPQIREIRIISFEKKATN